uniref:Actin n=1 Tax=Trichuris muris TaxID=70415 RepID=A0A5S6R445_TRIMR
MASYGINDERTSSMLRMRRYLDRLETMQIASDKEDQRSQQAPSTNANDVGRVQRESISKRHWQMRAENGRGSEHGTIVHHGSEDTPLVTCIKVNPDADSICPALDFHSPCHTYVADVCEDTSAHCRRTQVEYAGDVSRPIAVKSSEPVSLSERFVFTHTVNCVAEYDKKGDCPVESNSSISVRIREPGEEVERSRWIVQGDTGSQRSQRISNGQTDASSSEAKEANTDCPTTLKLAAKKESLVCSETAPAVNVGQRADGERKSAISEALDHSSWSNAMDDGCTDPKAFSHALTIIKVKPIQTKGEFEQSSAATEMPVPLKCSTYQRSDAWSVLPILRWLYKIECCCEYTKAYLEHLPPGQECNESDSAWAKHYFVASHGYLQWFENESEAHRIGQLNLLNARITWEAPTSLLKIQDAAEGAILILRLTKETAMTWLPVLQWQAREHLLMPLMPTPSHSHKKICVLEIGSCSTRVGLVQDKLTLPHMFFPSVLTATTEGGWLIGEEAAVAIAENSSHVSEHTWFGSAFFCRDRLGLDKAVQVLRAVCRNLSIHPSSFQLLLPLPITASRARLIDVLRILLKELQFKGVAIERQANLALIAFDAKTGVVVDIGDKLSIVAVYDGYVLSNTAVTMQSYTREVNRLMRNRLASKDCGLTFDTYREQVLLRYVKEKACFVSSDFAGDLKRSAQSSDKEFLSAVNLEPVDPDSSLPYHRIEISHERFETTEVLFTPKRWGLDAKGLHELVNQCIKSSPIDNRRELYKSIYLVGGTSLLPGLPERLESELRRLVPTSVDVKVHAAPWRYHASFLGAKILADTNLTQKILITRDNLDEFIPQSLLDVSVL